MWRARRTVLFVSHNMTAVQSLCEARNLLRGRRIRGDGNPKAEIQHIFHQQGLRTQRKWLNVGDALTPSERGILAEPLEAGSRSRFELDIRANSLCAERVPLLSMLWKARAVGIIDLRPLVFLSTSRAATFTELKSAANHPLSRTIIESMLGSIGTFVGE